ncbi:hypothetical protein D3C72_461880 [compost metagenome]
MYTTVFKGCDVPVGAAVRRSDEPAKKATRSQMETTKNATIIAIPANHTSDRSMAQSAR